MSASAFPISRASRGGGGVSRHAARRALCACVVALVCAAAVSAEDKRAESESNIVSPVPFVMGSRYGRSPERVMAPRNDRFFMGSRYGKRSETVLGMVGGGCRRGGGGSGGCAPLLCEYTGVMALYTCVSVRPHQHLMLDKRGEDDAGPGATEQY